MPITLKRTLFIIVCLSLLAWLVISRSSKADSNATVPLYSTGGTEQMGWHGVMGTATLAAGTVTITLSGKAVFTSNTTYKCTVADTTALNLTAMAYTSGSQFVITGVLTDNVSFLCAGN